MLAEGTGTETGTEPPDITRIRMNRTLNVALRPPFAWCGWGELQTFDFGLLTAESRTETASGSRFETFSD